MQETRQIMGMHATVHIADVHATAADIQHVYDYFDAVDKRFSTYKPNSEIMRINRGEIPPSEYSDEMNEVLALAQKTNAETRGFFDVHTPYHSIDPSGVVKGWAIQRAADMLVNRGYSNVLVDIGGDIQTYGTDDDGNEWSIGIQNPFNQDEIIKVVYPRNHGIATSGTYKRGQHIYNPHAPQSTLDDIKSLTVIGPTVLEADLIATAAFAMGRDGIYFIEGLSGFEGYAIDFTKTALMTTGFETYTTL